MAFAYTAAWADFAALARQIRADEAGWRRKFWRAVKREAASLPFLQAVFTAHYCIFDRHTPLYVKAVLAGAVAYCIVPDHLIPKHLPLIGLADDAAVIAIAMKAVSAHIEPEHRDAARRMLARMRSDVV